MKHYSDIIVNIFILVELIVLIKCLFIICFKTNWAMCCYCICVALLVYEYCTVDANALRGEKRAYRYVVL